MTRLAPLAALVLALTVAGTLAQPVAVLTVNISDGKTLVCRRMEAGDTVTLVFTHSMYGGEVRETWRADGNMLVRGRIVAERAAAAEYYATDGRTQRVDGGYEVIVAPLQASELPFRIDQIGNHRLRIDDEEIALTSEVSGPTGATLSASQAPLLARIVDSDTDCGT